VVVAVGVFWEPIILRAGVQYNNTAVIASSCILCVCVVLDAIICAVASCFGMDRQTSTNDCRCSLPRIVDLVTTCAIVMDLSKFFALAATANTVSNSTNLMDCTTTPRLTWELLALSVQHRFGLGTQLGGTGFSTTTVFTQLLFNVAASIKVIKILVKLQHSAVAAMIACKMALYNQAKSVTRIGHDSTSSIRDFGRTEKKLSNKLFQMLATTTYV